MFEAPEGVGGVYRSDDRGETFRLVSTEAGLLDRPFYYCNIDADPTNADVVYVNSTGYYKSVDGGRSWRRVSTPHGDNHDMWINPNDPDLYIQANDGGVNVTRDGGRTWSTQENQPTAEFYQVAVDDRYPYWVYAGQQDNTTIRVPSAPPYSAPGGPSAYWQSVGGCETGPAIPKPGDPNIVYANCKGRFGRYNFLTGQEQSYYVGAANMYGHNPADLTYRFQRVSPIHISPHDPAVIYHASQFLHRTTDEGVTWETISPDLTAFEPDKQMISGSPITRDITGEEFYSTIYAVMESPIERGVIWVGANDGPMHVTRDGGANWTNVTPPDLPKGGRVQNIEASPHDPAKAYFAAYRYLVADDFAPYIYRTTNYGRSWTRLTTGTNGVPADSPTRVVREDPDREGLLYAGTEFGMHISFDDGANWQSFQQNLPATPVTDIKVHRQDIVLSTMGRSFWIMDDVTPLHQIGATTNEPRLFQPKAAYRSRGGGGRGGSVPEYPTPGAHIDYYFPQAPSGEVTLEIVDGEGKLVRGYSSEAEGERWVVPAEPTMREFRLERVGTPRLPKGAGMHRFTWDMRHAGAWSAGGRGGRGGGGGPMVAPGRYQAKLLVGDWSRTVAFEVEIDPRVAADGVTREMLVEQEALALRVRDAISRGRMATDRLRIERRRLAGIVEAGGDGAARARSIDERLAEIEERFETASGRYMTPMLNDQLNYLNSMIEGADQRPGRDAYNRIEELEGRLNAAVADLMAAIGADEARLR